MNKKHNCLSTFVRSVDVECNAVLVNDYIKEHANKLVRGKVSSIDFDDIVQNANLNYWAKPGKGGIRDLKAYLYSVVFNAYMDYLRKKGRHIEINLVSLDDSYSNEAQAAMAIEASPVDDLLCAVEEVDVYVAVIVRLSRKEQLAMICHLKEKWLGDITPLVESFKRHGVDITATEWPADKERRQWLRTSLWSARQNFKKRLVSIKPLEDVR